MRFYINIDFSVKFLFSDTDTEVVGNTKQLRHMAGGRATCPAGAYAPHTPANLSNYSSLDKNHSVDLYWKSVEQK